MRWGIEGMDEARGAMLISQAREAINEFRHALDVMMEIASGAVELSRSDRFCMIWYTAFTAQQMRHVTETLVSSFAYTADRELLFDRLAVIHVPSGSDDGRSSAPEQVVAGTQQALRDCDALLADLQAAATRYAEERLDGSLPDSALEAYLKRWSS